MSNAPAWKIWLVFVGVFIAGGVTGGFISVRVAHQMVERGRHSAEFAPRLLKHFSDRLELTEAQQAQVKGMVDAAWQQMQEQRRASRDAMRELHEKVLAVLTAEQQVAFKQLQEDQRKRWQGMGERRGDGKSHRDGPPPPREGGKPPGPPPAPDE